MVWIRKIKAIDNLPLYSEKHSFNSDSDFDRFKCFQREHAFCMYFFIFITFFLIFIKTAIIKVAIITG